MSKIAEYHFREAFKGLSEEDKARMKLFIRAFEKLMDKTFGEHPGDYEKLEW